MAPTHMTFKLLVPHEVVAEIADVTRVVAETTAGSYGLLAHRRDCVAALVPGVLVLESTSGGERYFAVDEGLLVKTGTDVVVSVRRAMGGADLGALRDAVEEKFLHGDEHDESLRDVMTRLESGFLHRFASLHHD